MALNASDNRLFLRLTSAAKSALSETISVQKKTTRMGPSIRARARLALVLVFLVAAPTLFIGVLRTESVGKHAALLSQYDDFWKNILETHLILKELDLALWGYIYEPEFEHAQASQIASEKFGMAIAKLVEHKPEGFDMGPDGFYESLAQRLDILIKRNIAANASVAPARLSIMTISSELRHLEERVVLIAVREREQALGALATVGRDQLILFLILLFSLPIFVAFVPNWLVMPLVNLKKLVAKMDAGQIQDLAMTGHDEVASLSRVLDAYVKKHQDLEQKKSSKVFEMRNILRAVISRVQEPIFIVDPNTKINYTNDRAASLLGLPTHQVEGNVLSDFLFSTMLDKNIEKVLEGDVIANFSDIKVQLADGRELILSGKIGAVRNRNGDVSRAIIILDPKI